MKTSGLVFIGCYAWSKIIARVFREKTLRAVEAPPEISFLGFGYHWPLNRFRQRQRFGSFQTEWGGHFRRFFRSEKLPFRCERLGLRGRIARRRHLRRENDR